MASGNNYGTKQALKLVDEALQYDSRNENEVAYKKYLESVSVIATTLLLNRIAGFENHFSSIQRQKLIDTARQCLDRIDSLSQQLNVSTECSPKREDTIQSQLNTTKSDKIPPDPFLNSAHLQINCFVPNTNCLSVLETIDWVSAEDPMDIQRINSKDVAPIERAKKLNETLMSTYKARMETCTQNHVKINMALELHRRMAENLKIALEQQKHYLHDIQEKQRRRFEEVAEKMSQSGCKLKSDCLNTTANLYMEILKYSENKKWMDDFKQRLRKNPHEEKLIELVVRTTLRDREHPITKWLKDKTNIFSNQMNLLTTSNLNQATNITDYKCNIAKPKKPDQTTAPGIELSSFQDSYSSAKDEIEIAMEMGETLSEQLNESVKYKQELAKASVKFIKRIQNDKRQIQDDDEEPEEKTPRCDTKPVDSSKAFQEELEKLTSDINGTFSELVELFVLTYDQMENDTNRERCTLTLETIFFPEIWQLLSSLYQAAYADEINCVARSMMQMDNVTPADLDSSMKEISPNFESKCQQIIQLLVHITTLKVPHEKLQVLVHIVKLLCGSGLQPPEDVKKSRNMGADDLIPLLSYICIRSKLSTLMSECCLLERLINPRYLMGEEGYCLTSLQTAIKYIQSCECGIEPTELTKFETTV